MREEKEDFFEDIPEDKPVKVKAPKQPVIHPDDPRYYDGDEGRWDHLKPSPYNRRRFVAWGITLLCFLGVIVFLYILFFTPQVDQAVQYGYVDNVNRDGMIFKTYEGNIIPYTINDTVRPYDGDFVFSTRNEKVAAQLYRLRESGYPARVEYAVYRYRMPWRGNSKVIVLKADTFFHPERLLPADRRPEFSK